MNAPQRYLVAKYVPDTRRMEPVNVGVVAWAAGRAVARFLPPEEAAAVVNDSKTYQRWVNYWQGAISDSVVDTGSGAPVPVSNPGFLDEFAKTQQGNYLLAVGGQFTDRVPKSRLPEATDFLYDQLIARKQGVRTSPRERAVRLKFVSEKLFADAGLVGRDDFKKSYTVDCRFGVRFRGYRIKFNYAVASGSLGAVYQRVQLGTPQSVTSAAFMFEQVQRSGLLTKDRCGAIVQADARADDSDAQETVEMLRDFATVIDVTDHADALAQIAGIARQE